MNALSPEYPDAGKPAAGEALGAGGGLHAHAPPAVAGPERDAHPAGALLALLVTLSGGEPAVVLLLPAVLVNTTWSLLGYLLLLILASRAMITKETPDTASTAVLSQLLHPNPALTLTPHPGLDADTGPDLHPDPGTNLTPNPTRVQTHPARADGLALASAWQALWDSPSRGLQYVWSPGERSIGSLDNEGHVLRDGRTAST